MHCVAAVAILLVLVSTSLTAQIKKPAPRPC
jgi:hypothetical protein